MGGATVYKNKQSVPMNGVEVKEEKDTKVVLCKRYSDVKFQVNC